MNLYASFLLMLVGSVTLSIDITQASGDWTHVNGDEGGRRFLDLPPMGRSLDDAHTLRSVELESVLTQILAADVDGDAWQEMVGRTEDGKAIWLVKFGEQTAREVVSMETPGRTISLDALADLTGDGVHEILYSVQDAGQSVAFEAYDVVENCLCLAIPLGPDVGREVIYSAIDVDFDDSPELVSIGMSPDGEYSRFSVTSMDGELLYRCPDLDGVIADSSIAILREPEFRETWFFLGVNAKTPTSGEKSSNASISAFLMTDSRIVTLEWSKPLHPDLAVQRMAVGMSDDGRRILVLATRRRSQSIPIRDNFVSLVDVLNGVELNRYQLEQADCVDLALTDTDEDDGNEVLLLDSNRIIHKLDFTHNYDRSMTLAFGTMIIGACNMYRDPWPDVAMLQNYSGQSIITTLSETIDPLGQRSFLSVPGRLVGRPIFGDTDGNGYGEVLFVAEDGTPKAHRLSFRDPYPLDIPASVTPTPTPTPSAPSCVPEARMYP